MSSKLKLGVLISGRGSNLQSLIDAAQDPSFPAEIALVFSNVPGAAGLDRASKAGIATSVINHKDFDGRAPFEDALHATLMEGAVAAVVAAAAAACRSVSGSSRSEVR